MFSSFFFLSNNNNEINVFLNKLRDTTAAVVNIYNFSILIYILLYAFNERQF